MKQKYDIKALFIDYLQLMMSGNRSSPDSRKCPS